MTPTHAISADEARRLLAEDREEFERRRWVGIGLRAPTADEANEILKKAFAPDQLPAFDGGFPP